MSATTRTPRTGASANGAPDWTQAFSRRAASANGDTRRPKQPSYETPPQPIRAGAVPVTAMRRLTARVIMDDRTVREFPVQSNDPTGLKLPPGALLAQFVETIAVGDGKDFSRELSSGLPEVTVVRGTTTTLGTLTEHPTMFMLAMVLSISFRLDQDTKVVFAKTKTGKMLILPVLNGMKITILEQVRLRQLLREDQSICPITGQPCDCPE